MPKRWTQRRLEELFQKYNRVYFGGSLGKWGAAIGRLDEIGAVGLCEPRHKQLVVDTDHITSDAEVRSTLLHEMAHAAAPRCADHGYKFWEQIEQLLTKGAPITLGFPEAPNNSSFSDIIPKKLRLCCEAARKLEAQRVSKVLRHAKIRNLKTQTITDEEIIVAFAGAVYDLPCASESEITTVVAERYDLFDVGGKPKNAWAAQIISEGKKVYRKTKKEEREMELAEDAFDEHLAATKEQQ
jgi:SprT-like family